MSLVLVVDDDADSREILSEVLLDDGHSVRTSANGAEALALIEGGLHPDVMLLDLVMPEMSGDELIARMKTTDAASIPVIVLSGKPDWVPPAGVRVLRKPVELNSILDAMRPYAGPAPSSRRPGSS